MKQLLGTISSLYKEIETNTDTTDFVINIFVKE